MIKHLSNYFRYYSKPFRLISDRATCFTSQEFTQFLQERDIKHVLISTGVPRANGQVEVVNKSVRAMCAKLSESPNQWDTAIEEVEFAINNSNNTTTRVSPSQLLFGIDQRGKVSDHLRLFLQNEQPEDRPRDLAQIRQVAAQNIEKNQVISKKQYDQKHKVSRLYNVGDLVMISNQDVTPGVNKKFIPKYRGPYVIKAVLDNDRYIVGDIEGFQLTQVPYTGVLAPCRIKPWLE